jgi:polysaccharide biosynthesis transport protein
VTVDTHDPRLSGGGGEEPNIFASIWNHRMVVVASILLFAAAAVAVTTLMGRDYASRAGLLLQDPQPANASGSQPRDDAMRYVADQVAILKSRAVAVRASELTGDRAAKTRIDPGTLSDGLSVSSSDTSNYVTVTVRSSDAEASRAAANAVVQAYRELTRAKILTDANAARHRIELAISAAENAAAETTGSSPVARRQHAAALDLLDTLRGRLSDLEANARLTGDGVALVAPAARGTKQGVSLPVALMIAIVLGALGGAGAAYIIDSRRPRLRAAAVPREILGAPALAEIRDFDRDGVRTALPVIDAPGTASAEAFRFLAFELGLRQQAMSRSERPRSARFRGPDARSAGGAHVVAFVASSRDAGASTIVANTALAAAQEGRRVLAVDADIHNAGLTRLLCDDGASPTSGPGLLGLASLSANAPSSLDVLAAEGDVGKAMTVEGADGAVRVLPPGTAPADMMSVFQAEHVLATLDAFGSEFELVLLDVPPVVDVAYASPLLCAAASVVVVVRHRGGAIQLRNVRERLDLIGVRPIGYVYNVGARQPRRWQRAPRRAARTDAPLPSVASRATAVTSPRLQ